MPRTVFVTGTLPDGGAERHTISLLKSLAARGHDCHAVCVKPTAATAAVLQPAPSTLTSLAAGRYLDLAAVRRFSALLKRVKPQAIVAANPYALLYASIARSLARSPARLIVTFHSARALDFKERMQMLASRPLFWGADCTVFLCDRQRRYWCRRGLLSPRNLVIPNGIDTGHFRLHPGAWPQGSLRGKLGFSGTDFVIGLPALLRREKNHQQLLRAVAGLRRLEVPARALVIGDGEMRPDIEALARHLGIPDYVTITGLQPDVRPYLAACDVITLCSLSETFSLAALEAMAMGKPVVLSDVGGASEMVVPGWNGLLYPVGNSLDYLNCLLRLSDSASSRRMGVHARTMVEQRFAAGLMTDRYEALLGELCGKPDAAAMRPAQAP